MKKNTKLLTATILAIPAAAFVAEDMKVSASQISQEENVVVPGQFPKIQLPATSSSSSAPVKIEANDAGALKEALEIYMGQYKTEIQIVYTGSFANGTDLKNLISDTINTILKNRYKEGTFNGYEYTYKYDSAKATISMQLHYLTTATKESNVTTQVNYIVQTFGLGAGATDFEKIKAVHDYIILNSTYSIATNGSPYAAATLIEEKKGAAQAYALLAYRLLKVLNVEVDYVTGKVNGINHAWNAVKVDGQWYYLDSMMDDTLFSGVSNQPINSISYAHFLLRQNQAAKYVEDTGKDYHTITNGGTDYSAMHKISSSVQVKNELFFADRATGVIKKLELNNVSSGDSIVISNVKAEYLQQYNNWLYFSDASHGGFLYKVKIDGTGLTLLAEETVTSVNIASSILTYITASGGTKTIDLSKEDPIVQQLQALLTDIWKNVDASDIALKIVNAHVLIGKLTDSQKAIITNEKIVEFETLAKERNIIGDNQSHVNRVMLQIAELNSSSSTFIADVTKARSEFNNLSLEDQLKVLNINILKEAENASVGLIPAVTIWHNTVRAFGDDTPYTQIEKARADYDKMPLAQRSIIDMDIFEFLKMQEQKMATEKVVAYEIEYQIAVLNDNVTTYIADVERAKQAYDALKARQQAVVSNSKLKDAIVKAKQYKETAESFVTKVKAWATPPKLTDVIAARAEYNDFKQAVKGHITSIDSTVITILEKGVDAIAGTDEQVLEVSLLIENLDAINISEAAVKAANEAFGKLTTEQQSAISQILRDKLDKINDDIRTSLVRAEAVIALINSLTSDSSPEDIKQANEAYGNLSDFAKTKVPSAVKAKLDEYVSALKVKTLDTKLGSLTESAAADELLAIRTEYELLSASEKAQITNIAKLEILEAKPVVAAITALGEAPSKTALDHARSLFKALYAGAQAKVTNIDQLETLEAAYVDIEISKLTSVSTNAEIQFVRALVDSLTAGAIAKLTKLEVLEKLEEAFIDPAEKEAAKKVNDQIAKLDGKSSKQAITDARKAYNGLSEKAKRYIEADLLNKLVTLEAGLEAKEDLEKSAATVIAMIEKLNNNAKVEEIEAARKAYDALHAEAKLLVTNYPTLVALEEKFKNDLEEKTAKEQAEAVQALIDKLTIQSPKEEILAARAAYNALSAKALGYIKSITKLLDAEEHLKVTEEVDEKKAKEQAQVVNAMISKLTRSSTKEEVLAVQAAYTALSATAKKYVINYSFVQSLLAEFAKQEAAIAAAKASAAAFDKFMASVSRQSSNSTIAYARTYYNSLSNEAKQYVTTLSKLQKLEEQVSKNPSGPPKQPTHGNTKKEDLTGIIWPTDESNPASLKYIPDNEYVAFVQDGTDLQFTSYGEELFAYIPRDIILHQQEPLVITATSGVQVKLPIKDLQKTYGTVSVSLTIEEGEFDFIVSVNGQSIAFAEQVEIKIPTTEIKSSSNATVYKIDGKNTREQVPFEVKDGIFTIKTKSTGNYEVSNTPRTFIDAMHDPNRTYIEELSKRGVLAGTIGNNYFPKDAITRADFAVMLAKGANLTSTSHVQFNDIRGKAYASEIQALFEAGVMNGTGPTRFNANGHLTRQQAAVIIHRYLDYLKVDIYAIATPTNLTFTDGNQFSEEGMKSIVVMDMLGIFSANEKGEFNPNSPLTRSEMAEVLYLTMEIAGL
ncbi:S-layer homology domain-containing protein [Solibacillus sp. CAU 1738]|uniref:S-layer homology domain-containing protein n=1 Tax=Solibacillus sp. CAU 1738 TaxID=3140363 RepID=UPI003260A4AB